MGFTGPARASSSSVTGAVSSRYERRGSSSVPPITPKIRLFGISGCALGHNSVPPLSFRFMLEPLSRSQPRERLLLSVQFPWRGREESADDMVRRNQHPGLQRSARGSGSEAASLLYLRRDGLRNLLGNLYIGRWIQERSGQDPWIDHKVGGGFGRVPLQGQFYGLIDCTGQLLQRNR